MSRLRKKPQYKVRLAKATKFFSGLTTALTTAIVLMTAGLLVLQFIGIRSYTVLSGSMEPVIETGSLAFIKEIPEEQNYEPKTGEIVMYAAENGEVLVTHRIVRAEEGCFITKGDANETEDLLPVTRAQIKGTYLFSVKKAGYAVKAVTGKGPVPLILIVTGMNILSSIAETLVREKAKDSMKKPGKKPSKRIQKERGN